MTAVPLLLDLDGVPVTCVGGGPVAESKVVPLAQAGALVTVISPDITSALAATTIWEQHPYRAGDLARGGRPRLVVAASGQVEVDDAVAAEAAELGVWCLRVDGRGDVAVPSVLRQGGLLLAAATGAPALTRRVRQELAAVFDGRWGRAATMLAELRADPEVRAALGRVAPEDRRRRWHDLVTAVIDGDPPPTPQAARARLVGEPPDP